MSGHRGLRSTRWLVAAAALPLLAGCRSDDAPMVGGSVTQVRHDGRVCIEVERNDARPRTLCGSWFPPGPIALEHGDCFRARWSPDHGGEFSDLRYAGHCLGEPQARIA